MAYNRTISLKGFVQRVMDKKANLYCRVYLSLLSISEEILNCKDKNVLFVFASLSSGTSSPIINSGSDADEEQGISFHISHSDIGKLCGLSGDQVWTVMQTLVIKIKKINDEKLLAVGEFMELKITDAFGNELDKNKTGVATCYEFEYTEPQIKKKFKIQVRKEEPEPAQIINAAEAAAKKKEFERLKDFFPMHVLEEFLIYDLTAIRKTINYYLLDLAQKKRENPAAILRLSWLRKAFEEKYHEGIPDVSAGIKKSPPVKQKTPEELKAEKLKAEKEIAHELARAEWWKEVKEKTGLTRMGFWDAMREAGYNGEITDQAAEEKFLKEYLKKNTKLEKV